MNLFSEEFDAKTIWTTFAEMRIMHRLIAFFMVVGIQTMNGQEYSDLIVTNTNDTLKCRIIGLQEIDDSPDFLQFEKVNGPGQGKIPMTMVLNYRMNGDWIGSDKITIEDVFENPAERLLNSVILDDKSLSTTELKTQFKNWGQTHFVNFNEVLVGETENQITINYIEEYTFRAALGVPVSVKHYIRLVCQIKEGRLRVLMFDDGNCFVPSSQYSASTAARSYYISDFFKDNTPIDKDSSPVNFRRIRSFQKETSSMKTALQQILTVKSNTGILNEDW